MRDHPPADKAKLSAEAEEFAALIRRLSPADRKAVKVLVRHLEARPENRDRSASRLARRR